MYLTDRDCEIVQTLVYKVRLLTNRQIHAAWWGTQCSRDSATRRLKMLRDAGLLDRYDVLARPMLTLCSPIYTWIPNGAEPDFVRAAHITRNRWVSPPEVQTVYVASRFAGNWLGGAGGRLRRNDVTHDLHVAGLYLLFRSTRPADAHAWVGEDLVPKAGWKQKDPDAWLKDRADLKSRVIEFAGAYDEDRLADFHRHCVRQGLAYELW